MYASMIKPMLDVSLALVLLLLLAPIYLLTSIMILVSMGRPLIFAQTRPGRNEKLFTIYKFRTMNNTTDAQGELLPDEQRLNGIGKLIRSLSLDELPQLWNVLKGDMSFIGPRPLLIEYLTLYNHEQKRRHDVKPGITGWAQVNGRNAISWEKKFQYDLYYVDHLSFGLDMKIVWLTIKKVFLKEGVNAEGQATTEKFNGTN